MKLLHSWLRNNFGYSRKEINGTLVLAVFTFLLFGFSFVWDYWLYSKNPLVTEQDEAVLEQWLADLEWEPAEPPGRLADPASPLVHLKPFDPNAVSKEELLAMNVPAFAAGNWQKFLQKGGRFYRADDLRKVYGLDSAIFEQLQAYLRFPEARHTEKTVEPAERKAKEKTVTVVKTDINRATAAELQQVNGIGPVLSERIVKFRGRLGGFAAREQLLAVYGLKPEVVERLWGKFDLDTASCCTRISLNTTPFDSLRQHPYLNYNQARAIVAYREQHGPFRNWQEVSEVKILSDSLIHRLKLYFEVGVNQ